MDQQLQEIGLRLKRARLEKNLLLLHQASTFMFMKAPQRLTSANLSARSSGIRESTQAIRLAEAKEELARRTEVYTKLVDEISEKMTGLDDPEEEVLLTNHYLKHLSLLAVAREMHRGNSWVYDHHDAAIKKLDKILAESGDSEAS